MRSRLALVLPACLSGCAPATSARPTPQPFAADVPSRRPHAERTPLVVAFGDAALRRAWFPHFMAADFAVEGMNADERRARAGALVAACHVAAAS